MYIFGFLFACLKIVIGVQRIWLCVEEKGELQCVEWGWW